MAFKEHLKTDFRSVEFPDQTELPLFTRERKCRFEIEQKVTAERSFIVYNSSSSKNFTDRKSALKDKCGLGMIDEKLNI